ncbi:hypothetical protein B5X24_HaOG210782 [Helicoverpa armigera]|uniref:Uncharacterized protein n=1 Tax=Helicoverpa armigera TaxID=29058 RepID=A0A2W1BBI5_HELAM|nr:hypothetical protein B5X24_HaOG210782 [Helicoverpa armigera]
MSFITLKNEFNEDILACRACLATDKKLYSIYQNDNVLYAYKNLIGSEVYPYDTLPQYICNYCSILLLKYNTFKDDCQRAAQYLEDARINGTIITQEYLTNFKPQVQYKKTKIKHINYNNNNYIENHTNFIKDTTNDSYINDYTSLDIENSQMDTQNIEIKAENNIAAIETELQNKTLDEKKSSLVTENSQMVTQKIEIKEEINTITIGYMSEDILKKHILSQHDKSRGDIVCEFCKFRYKDRRGLNHHLKTHRLKFICKQCAYVSRTTFNAKEHFKMHGGQVHQCSHCGKSHEKLSSHLSHVRLNHPSSLVWCHICAQACVGEFGLNAHIKKAHRHCDKTFKRENLYSAHYKRIHVDNQDKSKKKKEKPWICEVCGKTLPNKSLLLYHQRNHTGEKPYRCTQCTKSFTMRKLLQSHLRVHTNDRPYVCKLCPKTFKGLSALRGHEYVSTSFPPSSSEPFSQLCWGRLPV